MVIFNSLGVLSLAKQKLKKKRERVFVCSLSPTFYSFVKPQDFLLIRKLTWALTTSLILLVCKLLQSKQLLRVSNFLIIFL